MEVFNDEGRLSGFGKALSMAGSISGGISAMSWQAFHMVETLQHMPFWAEYLIFFIFAALLAYIASPLQLWQEGKTSTFSFSFVFGVLVIQLLQTFAHFSF